MKDFFTQIRERFSNPLIFSFLISWLIANWQITVALFWYDQKQIQASGAKSIFDFISRESNWYSGFCLPLIIAIIYTFVMPIIRNVTRAFQVWALIWGERWELNIQKGGQIPIEKYIGLKNNYDKRTKVLESIIRDERELVTKYDELNNRYYALQIEKNEAQQKLTEFGDTIAQLNNVSILNGYWTKTHSDSSGLNGSGTEEVYIEDGKYSIVGDFGNKAYEFNIRNFYFNNTTKRIFFTKELSYDSSAVQVSGYSFIVNILRFEKEDMLVGKEDGTIDIQYVRKAKSVTVLQDNPVKEID